MRKPFFTFLVFLFYRLSSAFIIQTSYVPDEYWQSLEVAHNMAFGYGYLTWEWKQGLRSYLYPSFFAALYKCLEFFGIDFPFFIIVIPKIFQAILTAVSDQCFFLLCRNFGFNDYWPKLYLFTNWFWYYCGCRTITNTFETSFTIIALYYYPWTLFVKGRKGNKKTFQKIWPEVKNKSIKYMTLSAVSCVVRPTAVTIWGPLFVFQLVYLPLKFLKQFVLSCIMPVVLVVSFISFSVDFFCYGKITIPTYNFLLFNIFKEVSAFYGTHPIHWYITQGLPAVLGLQYLPFSVGFLSVFSKIRSSPVNKVFVILIFILVLNIAILSSIPHKEFRFILPLLPLMMLIVVKVSSDFFTHSLKTYRLIWTGLLAVGFIIPTVLFGVLHQRGTLELMNYLRSSASDCNHKCSFLFLMPCHSTPLYSHLHMNVTTRFLTCEPPLTDNHYDESEDFFNNPSQWLSNHWDDKNPPSHVILFEGVRNSLSSFLAKKQYVIKQEILHTVFPERKLGKYIVVYEPT